MKNLTLGLILTSLLALAYYFEEIERPESEDQLSKAQSVLKLERDQLTHINLPNVKLQKNKDDWSFEQSEDVVSYQVVESFIDRVFKTHKLRSIQTDKPEVFFRNTSIEFQLKTKQKTVEFVFGDVVVATGNFYLKVDDKIYLVKDTSLFQGFYKNEQELLLKKYISYRDMLLSDALQFMDRRIFSKIKTYKLISHNNNFSVDFEKGVTSPAAPNKIKYQQLDEFKKALESQVLFTNKEKVDQSKLSDKAFKVLINNSEEYIVFLKKEGMSGVYLYSLGTAWTIRKDQLKLLNTPIQKLWSKKFNLNSSIFKSHKLDFFLVHKGEVFSFEITDTDEFVIKSEHKFNKKLMNLLFNIILNNTSEFSQARRLESKDLEEKSRFSFELQLLDDSFTFYILEESFKVYQKSTDLFFYYEFDVQSLNFTDFGDLIDNV